MSAPTYYLAVATRLWAPLQEACHAHGLTPRRAAGDFTGTKWHLTDGVRLTHVEADQLSDRQMHVLALWAQGATDQQIASVLGISINTVKSQAKAAMGKLGARNRAHAVHIGHWRGLLGGGS